LIGRLRARPRGYLGGMKSFVKATAERLSGGRPGVFRAVAGATAAGGATWAVVYKLLRHEDEE
jgi:hypothetical protein